MKCPQCSAEGQLSRVVVGPSYTNAVNIPTIYDEQGALVVGRAGGKTSYSCTRGHKWTETVSPSFG